MNGLKCPTLLRAGVFSISVKTDIDKTELRPVRAYLTAKLAMRDVSQRSELSDSRTLTFNPDGHDPVGISPSFLFGDIYGRQEHSAS